MAYNCKDIKCLENKNCKFRIVLQTISMNNYLINNTHY